MALTEDNGGSPFTMPVAPMYGGGNGFNNGFGCDWAWIILLLLLGWGNNGWGGNGFGGFDGGIYPWMNQANLTSEGFQNQLMNDNITSIRDGVTGISTQLCNGFSDVQMAMANGFFGVEQGANARQIADMNRSFALQSQLADCCCENRLATADLKYTIATEECATRNNDTANTQSVLNAINGGIQSIKDQLCADKIDAKNDEISQLRQELLYSRGQASQVAQTGAITDAVYARFKDCPVGTTPVYGQTPIFTCNNGGCGCGCGGNSFFN